METSSQNKPNKWLKALIGSIFLFIILLLGYLLSKFSYNNNPRYNIYKSYYEESRAAKIVDISKNSSSYTIWFNHPYSGRRNTLGFGRETLLHEMVIMHNIKVGDSVYKPKNSSIIYFFRDDFPHDTLDFRIFYRNIGIESSTDSSFTNIPKFPFVYRTSLAEKYLIPEALKYPPYDSIWKVPPEEWPERKRK